MLLLQAGDQDGNSIPGALMANVVVCLCIIALHRQTRMRLLTLLRHLHRLAIQLEGQAVRQAQHATPAVTPEFDSNDHTKSNSEAETDANSKTDSDAKSKPTPTPTPKPPTDTDANATTADGNSNTRPTATPTPPQSPRQHPCQQWHRRQLQSNQWYQLHNLLEQQVQVQLQSICATATVTTPTPPTPTTDTNSHVQLQRVQRLANTTTVTSAHPLMDIMAPAVNTSAGCKHQ